LNHGTGKAQNKKLVNPCSYDDIASVACDTLPDGKVSQAPFSVKISRHMHNP
jgi:hypothetical protein